MADQVERPWELILFRAAVWPTVLAGLVVAGIAAYTRGLAGLLGALLGVALVVASFGLGLYVARRTARLHPLATMTAAMSSYLFKITALLLVLILVRRTGAVDRSSVGFSVLVSVLVWLGAEIRAFLGLKLLSVDPAASEPD